MSFPEAQGRLQQAVFDRLGEDAAWSGIAGTVRVRWREADEELHLDRGAIVETGRRIKVRRSDVSSPTKGQQVQILDQDGAPIAGQLFVVVGKPTLDRKGVWTCKVDPAP